MNSVGTRINLTVFINQQLRIFYNCICNNSEEKLPHYYKQQKFAAQLLTVGCSELHLIF